MGRKIKTGKESPEKIGKINPESKTFEPQVDFVGNSHIEVTVALGPHLRRAAARFLVPVEIHVRARNFHVSTQFRWILTIREAFHDVGRSVEQIYITQSILIQKARFEPKNTHHLDNCNTLPPLRI